MEKKLFSLLVICCVMTSGKILGGTEPSPQQADVANAMLVGYLGKQWQVTVSGRSRLEDYTAVASEKRSGWMPWQEELEPRRLVLRAMEAVRGQPCIVFSYEIEGSYGSPAVVAPSGMVLGRLKRYMVALSLANGSLVRLETENPEGARRYYEAPDRATDGDAILSAVDDPYLRSFVLLRPWLDNALKGQTIHGVKIVEWSAQNKGERLVVQNKDFVAIEVWETPTLLPNFVEMTKIGQDGPCIRMNLKELAADVKDGK